MTIGHCFKEQLPIVSIVLSIVFKIFGEQKCLIRGQKLFGGGGISCLPPAKCQIEQWNQSSRIGQPVLKNCFLK